MDLILLSLFAAQLSGLVSCVLMRDSLQTQFVHSEVFCFLFFVKYDSGYCVCEQDTEEAAMCDFISVRVVLQAQILSTSGHMVAYDV